MLTPPNLSSDTISASLREHFGIPVAHVVFLPIGADVDSAVYRVAADNGTAYLLKLRRGAFNEAAVLVPALLHARGIEQIMAPIATLRGQWWAQAHSFIWLLYPFFEGQNGFRVALSPAQWRTFGASMNAVHTTKLPADLIALVPREDYAPRWRKQVRAFQAHAAQRRDTDPIAARFAAFWRSKHEEIRTIVTRAEQLAQVAQQHADEFVVCHADLHAGNVLAGPHDTLAIVDWDEVLLAPKERDLMFVGAGIGDVWKEAQEAAWFYAGYGSTEIDPAVLAYYRYERIVADLAAYGEQIFGVQGSAADREEGLRQLTGQFDPNSLVTIAHQSYMALV